MEPAATKAAGMYCKDCGYDLRGSLERGRCPECGRAFVSDDPWTYRTRPFPSLWQRVLYRLSRRSAILLAVLLFLAALWGWFDWGRRQEQAALAGVGARKVGLMPLGGPVGRRIEGWNLLGDVLLRVYSVDLPLTACDANLVPLPKLNRLVSLNVANAPITDAGILHLRGCRNLRFLNCTHTRITDAGLVHLRDLRNLEHLELGWTSITGTGLTSLAGLSQLRCLRLDRAPVTDAGLGHLASLKGLRELTLADTSITDAGLVHVAKLRGLEQLALERTRITDAGLVELAKLPALRELRLGGTRVTPAGAGRLKAALPGCTIEGP